MFSVHLQMSILLHFMFIYTSIMSLLLLLYFLTCLLHVKRVDIMPPGVSVITPCVPL